MACDYRDVPMEPQGEAVHELLLLLRSIAISTSKRHRIPDHQDDLIQQAFGEAWEHWRASGRRPTKDDLQRSIRRLASVEAAQRKRELALGDRTVDQRSLPTTDLSRAAGGVPPLLPRLLCWVADSNRATVLSRHLLASAAIIAREPNVLSDAQYRLFACAYMHQ